MGCRAAPRGIKRRFFFMFLFCQTKADEAFLSREKVVAGPSTHSWSNLDKTTRHAWAQPLGCGSEARSRAAACEGGSWGGETDSPWLASKFRGLNHLESWGDRGHCPWQCRQPPVFTICEFLSLSAMWNDPFAWSSFFNLKVGSCVGWKGVNL